MGLFRKAAVFTDIHFGAKNDSEEHNLDNLAFIEWFMDRVDEYECDYVICMGDYFHNRKYTNLRTAYYGNRGIDRLNRRGLPIFIIAGNHDVFYEERRDVHSLEYLRFRSSLITEPRVILDVGFVPWMVGDEYRQVIDMQCKYLFGHFHFPTFLYNAMIEAKQHGEIHHDMLDKPKAIFSGHFHKRQLKVNKHGVPVYYIGNPFGHDFNDVNDRERGMMVLEWDQEPVFLNYDAGPNYQRLRISTLLDYIAEDRVAERFNKNSIIECHNDLDLSQDDSLQIKETLQQIVRSIYIIDNESSVDITTETELGDQSNDSVNSMVAGHLGALDTVGSELSTGLLVELWEQSA